MSSHNNRGRITILPIDSAIAKWRWQYLTDEIAHHHGWQPVALVEDGCLVRHKVTRRLRLYRAGRILSVDERKAAAAIVAGI